MTIKRTKPMSKRRRVPAAAQKVKTATPAATGGWQRRRIAVSMQIEKSALELFEQRGIDAVTVEEIAAAAAISRRTFYRYFDGPNDTLTAAFHRALQRTARQFAAGPLHEPILDSFLAGVEHEPTPKEKEISALGYRVMRRSPEAWMRAMAQMRPNAIDVYREMIAQRLRARGRDPTPAGFVATMLSALIHEVCRQCEQTGAPLNAATFARALDGLIDTLGDIRSERLTRRVAKKRKS